MTTVSVEVGAVTSASARVIARITGTVPRLAVSPSADLSQPIYFDAESTASDGAAAFTATGLTADTDYWFAIEDGTIDTTKKGRFHTHAPVGTAWSHTIATYGDAGLSPVYPGSGSELVPNRVSNAPTFDNVRLANPLMAVCLGDRTYYDLGPDGNHGVVGGGSLSNYRRMYSDILLQDRQHQLVREIPSQYMWDNHDFGLVGAYSDGDHPDKANAAAAYRERVPHYPTPEPTGSPYQAWQVGRTLYILNDTRYNRSAPTVSDGPGKTMLGQAQLAWMFNLLETTTAEALVWLMPTPWLHDDGGLHHWGSYTHERDEIISFLTTTPVPASNGSRMWAQSLVQVTPDIHALGLCSPGHNGLGGFPVMLTAAVDATPHHGNDAVYDLGYQGGRDQWGTVGISDDGDQITITLTGWVGPSPWGAQQLLIPTSTPVPTPEPAPPAIAIPVIRSSVTWLGVHRSTGQIIAELPDVTGAPERQLSAYANTQLSIPLGPIPIQQIEACTDGESGAIVCVINDLPMWMGLPTDRDGGSEGNLIVPTVTPEGYLPKRTVKNHNLVGVDRALVAYQVALDAEALDGQWQGLRLEYDIELTGDLIDIEYKATDRTSVYDALRALCEQGIEFEIAYDWADANQNRIVKILRIRRRIGRTTGTPAAMFETDAGSAIDYRLKESWQAGRYANHVTAIAPGQGDGQPASTPAINSAALAAGVPIVELVVEPGNNITEQGLLDLHATANLQRTQRGSSVIEIDAPMNSYPRLGFDCLLGDMVSYRLSGPRHPVTPMVGERRMTGWRADPEQGAWTPKLVEDPALTLELTVEA